MADHSIRVVTLLTGDEYRSSSAVTRSGIGCNAVLDLTLGD